MVTDKQWEELAVNHEIAYLRADICISSPESFSLDEKRQICEDMAISDKEIEDAIRKEFHSMPDFAQKRMLELLCGADPANYEWWVNLLYHTED